MKQAGNVVMVCVLAIVLSVAVNALGAVGVFKGLLDEDTKEKKENGSSEALKVKIKNLEDKLKAKKDADKDRDDRLSKLELPVNNATSAWIPDNLEPVVIPEDANDREKALYKKIDGLRKDVKALRDYVDRKLSESKLSVGGDFKEKVKEANAAIRKDEKIAREKEDADKAKERFDKMAEKIGLSAAEKDDLKKILDKRNAAIQVLRANNTGGSRTERMQDYAKVRDEAEASIKKMLTEEQFKTYKSEERSAMRAWGGRRGGGGRGGRGR